MIILNERRGATHSATIRAPWDGAEVGIHPLAAASDMDAAVAANVAAADACRHMPAYERAACLRRIAEALESRAAEFAELLSREAGKPIAQAKIEVERAVFVFRDGAEEAARSAEAGSRSTMPAGRPHRPHLLRTARADRADTLSNFPVRLAAHNRVCDRVGPRRRCAAAAGSAHHARSATHGSASGLAGREQIAPCDLGIASGSSRTRGCG
jgi:acyl-CoA reductase-like NAD-dependent aldehyde dehydrogenase